MWVRRPLREPRCRKKMDYLAGKLVTNHTKTLVVIPRCWRQRIPVGDTIVFQADVPRSATQRVEPAALVIQIIRPLPNVPGHVVQPQLVGSLSRNWHRS